MFLGLLWCNTSFAESALPPCQGEDHTKFVNCFGSYVGKDYSEIHNLPGLTSDYTGEFGNLPGLAHGKGTFEIYVNGEYEGKCKGEVKYDLMNGEGICIWRSGEQYVGEFKDDLFHGQGTYTYADGKVEKGIWKNDKLYKAEDKLYKAEKEKNTVSLSDLSNLLIINKPPLKLFGIKLFENINKYSKDKILKYEDLEKVYGDEENKDPYLNKIRWVDANDLVVIKNDNFDTYSLYVNEKLEIEGIDGTNEAEFEEDEKLQKCLNFKEELITKIVVLHNLNINNFKVQNYVYSKDDSSEHENNIVSQSIFKFNHDGINLSYSLTCEIFVDANASLFWIELYTEKLNAAIYSQIYSKSEKNIEQLLNLDLKGF